MKILVATSEAVPFANTGGLGDVCGALPVALARAGHQASVILPAYRSAWYCGLPIESTGIEFIVPVGSKTVSGRLLRSYLNNGAVPVYLVQQDEYFDREYLYGVDKKDYPDNCERFVFFSRAVMESIRLLELDLDVLHANDWQTGLVPAYLKILYRNLPRYEKIACLFTVHNMGYQGQFWHWDMLLTGLDWKYFNWHQMEFYGKLNLLKTGLVFADAISTVSPRYAQEIQGPEQGHGLEGVVQHRAHVLYGILNGIDVEQWNPATDPFIAAHYTIESIDEGKPLCKAALQQEVGLPQRSDIPLIGFIGRLTVQKGLKLLIPVMKQWAEETDVQWVVLGFGEEEFHQPLQELARQYPDRVAVRLEFSTPLSHRIEAGADMLVMPSLYEPCGLNQMYSHRYGTVPIVRATGGLADTVVDTTPQTLAAGTANGFCFVEYSTQALDEALRRACEAWRQPALWRQLQTTGMRQDWSWARSAREYIRVYEEIVARKRAEATPPESMS
ncbi:MAG: glycogen synthase GlgA [Thermoguttaceae bacterium]|nr:glycogen synthase GlgA [Thermoguttaceae bacterium]MDW8037385.1 glycogen synthase GlgA [Thermoguttaceae bacterium]